MLATTIDPADPLVRSVADGATAETCGATRRDSVDQVVPEVRDDSDERAEVKGDVERLVELSGSP